MCVFGLKMQLFQYQRYSILMIRYSILFDTVKRFKIWTFHRYSIRYSQGCSGCLNLRIQYFLNKALSSWFDWKTSPLFSFNEYLNVCIKHLLKKESRIACLNDLFRKLALVFFFSMQASGYLNVCIQHFLNEGHGLLVFMATSQCNVPVASKPPLVLVLH